MVEARWMRLEADLLDVRTEAGIGRDHHFVARIAERLRQRHHRMKVAVPNHAGEDDEHDPAYIRKTPKRVSGIGAWRAASIPIVRTRRVSRGSITPSSQSRAVAK